jgi:glycosyltransferase involved in cell wall biosynthesis
VRLLFVADGRSPTALNWIRYFVDKGHEVHLASTFAAHPEMKLASFEHTPVAFSEVKTGKEQTYKKRSRQTLLWSASLVGLRTSLRQWIGPVTLPGAARRLKDVIRRVQPDLIHAMRIPYEGMLGALSLSVSDFPEVQFPLVISVWGNDFTLHAPANPWMRYYTRLALSRTNALHTDCFRDLRLAKEWGFSDDRPSVVLPGSGGLQIEIFHRQIGELGAEAERKPVVVNPRGFRSYVRNDTFFQAIPLVLRTKPEVRFLCPAMAGESQALRWLADLAIQDSVELLPMLSRLQMADLFRQAQVAVSPSIHDGTPNTLLEAMACGCFPVAGDLESIREWITPEVNGLLIDSGNPKELADAILLALERSDLRSSAAEINQRLVAEKADYRKVMGKAERFYEELLWN